MGSNVVPNSFATGFLLRFTGSVIDNKLRLAKVCYFALISRFLELGDFSFLDVLSGLAQIFIDIFFLFVSLSL